jgi:hypothetical protein
VLVSGYGTHRPEQITGWIDQGLNEKAYIIPGLGDFGERRFVINLCVLEYQLMWLPGIVHETTVSEIKQ